MKKYKGEKVAFALSKIEFLEAVDDAKFARAKIYAFKTGKNSHMITAAEAILKEFAETILDVPLVCYYDKRTKDLAGHEPGEVSIGYVDPNAKITYEKDETDGETWLVVEAKIWKRYSGQVLKLFKESLHKKPVSVELIVTESEKSGNETIMKQFAFFAVTILGSLIPPAVAGANAEIIKYSQEEYEKDKAEEENKREENINMKEYLEKFGMTYVEMREVISMSCREKKYQEEGSDYAYSKYYVVDFCEKYAYVSDNETGKYQALPYSFEDEKCMVDFENAKDAKRAWMVDESNSDMTDNGVMTMAKIIIASDEKMDNIADENLVFESKVIEATNTEAIEAKNLEIADFEKSISEKDSTIKTLEDEKNKLVAKTEAFEGEILELNNSINAFGSDLDASKETINSLTKANEELEEFKIEATATFEAIAKSERISKVSFITRDMEAKGSKMPEAEVEEWTNKALNFSENEEWSQYEEIEVWEKDFKAATVEYLSAVETKVPAHSRWALDVTDDENKSSGSGRWKDLQN